MTALTIRRWHSYIGLFIAPSVLFFALTGALQIFSLHEAHGDYRPATVIAELSSVHKDQVFERPKEHAPPAQETKPESDAHTSAQPPESQEPDHPATFVLKCFFFLVALALTVSTSLGIWMGFTQTRRKGLASILFVAGCLTPLILVAL